MHHIGRLTLVGLLIVGVGAAAMYTFGGYDAGFRLPRGSLARNLPAGALLPPAPAFVITAC